MTKVRSILVVLSAVIAFLLPSANNAQAAKWIAPAGAYLWTVEGSFCQNGATIVAIVLMYHEFRESVAFGAYQTTAHGSDIPQQIESVPISNKLGGVYLLIENQAEPLEWVSDEPYQRGTTYVYGKARLGWAELPVGTTVAVKRTESSGNFFVGNVTDCRL